jgi:hypothetical protein
VSLRAAIDGLTRKLGLGPAGAPPPCAQCAPRATPGRTTVITRYGEQPRSCEGCGRTLDTTGAPVGVQTPRGRYELHITTDAVTAPETQ